MSRRVVVRPACAEDAEPFLEAMAASRSLHHPWATAPRTPADFASLLTRSRTDEYEALVVLERASGALAGFFALSEIVRRSFQSAYVGYYAAAALAGRGLMTEALSDVVDHAFDGLRLHRLEANIQPDNGRSIALVRRCGFRREGFSPRLLHIDGAWRDHERWAVTAEDRSTVER